MGRKGKLGGDLYLVGGGDPTFGSSAVTDLAKQVRRAGIRKVSGTVIGDDSVFDRRRGVPDTNYAPGVDIAPLSGLTYGGSTYDGDPAKEAARAFRDGLRSAGVKVGGKVKVDRIPRRSGTRTPSPPTTRRRSRRSSGRRTRTGSTSTPRCC